LPPRNIARARVHVADAIPVLVARPALMLHGRALHVVGAEAHPRWRRSPPGSCANARVRPCGQFPVHRDGKPLPAGAGPRAGRESHGIPSMTGPRIGVGRPKGQCHLA
jgi:hypothetical protein